MADTRVEKDSLGEREVPSEALYGIQTQRAMENFPISGLRAHPVFVESYCMIKQAAARANKELGLLEPEVADAIARAADEVLNGRHREQFVVDAYQAGAGTSHNMNTNEVLANRALEILGEPRGSYGRVHPNDHVNMAQSTNDTFPTAIRVSAVRLLDRLVFEVSELASSFEEKGRSFRGIVKSGRTHLQDAMPIGQDQVFEGFGRTLRKCVRDLQAAQEALCELNLGGTAVGTGINAHPEYRERAIRKLADRTGHPFRPADDMVEIMQSMGDMVTASGAMRRLAVDAIKISNDLRLLSSGPRTGLGEIRLPAVQPGSSMMPGKVNPVIAECMDMIGMQVVGLDAAVQAAAQHGLLDLNSMMPLIGWDLCHMAEILANGARMLRDRCVEGIEVDEDRCREHLERSVGGAAILNPIVGYAKAAEVAKEAVRTGRSLKKVVVEKGILTAEEWDRLFDPENVTRPGVPGRGAGGER